MLNELNSVLLEGTLVTDPVPDFEKNTCTLLLENHYAYHDILTGTQKVTNYFIAEASGELAKTCLAMLKKGHGARVVGRLRQDRWVDDNGDNQSQVVVVAEHVEFKPVKKQEIQEAGD